jgi:hypothetical protein
MVTREDPGKDEIDTGRDLRLMRDVNKTEGEDAAVGYNGLGIHVKGIMNTTNTTHKNDGI